MKNKKILISFVTVFLGISVSKMSLDQAISHGPIQVEQLGKSAFVQKAEALGEPSFKEIPTWSDFENEVKFVQSAEEIMARVQSIDGFISSKNLIVKLNQQEANPEEKALAISLLRERSMLMKRKMELELERIEKEYL
ncbi:MAG: hypothetical protein Fur0010_04490 [Bdellovibrio sp.]